MTDITPLTQRWDRDMPILINFLVHRQQVRKFQGTGTTVADIIAELRTMGLYESKAEAIAFIGYAADQCEIFPTIDDAHYCSTYDTFTLLK